MRDRVRQVLNVVLALAMVVIGVVSNTGLNGPTIGEISAQTRSVIVPAGYAFSIWTVLYVGSLVYAIDQVLPANRRDPLLRRVGAFTAVAFAATTLWVIVFQQRWFILSNIIILCLLLSLIVVVWWTRTRADTLVGITRWTVYGNFSLFLGWIIIAAAANLAQTCVALGMFTDRGTHLLGATALLVLAGLGAIYADWRLRGNLPFAVAIVWAMTAIAVEHRHDARPVAVVALVLTVLFVVMAFISRARRARTVAR